MTSRTIRTSLLALGLAAAAVATATVAACQTQSHGDPKLAAQAKVKLDTARAIAIKAQPGTVNDWELEKEAGGSGLRYSFYIEAGGKVHEVGIDAADGKMLENVVETAEDEAREAKEDRASGHKIDEDDEDEEHERQ